MIDSHCHLDDARFADDLDGVLARAQAQGIERFIMAGVHHRQWYQQQKIQRQYQGVFNAFGIHPWFCLEHQSEHFNRLESLLSHAVAIGECGLDFCAHRPDKAWQKRCFQRHITLSNQTGLPLIIHSVHAHDTTLMMLKPYPSLRGVMHGFSGSLEQAKNFLRLGFFIGMGTRVLNPHAKKLRKLACELPLESILLESDAPSGLPKGERNEPVNIRKVSRYIASLRNQDENIIVAACNKNAEELFQL
ncbi:MAG: TatD family hydrolase [Zetaproteobacteria bacterium]|nr:TatD family hydrolase [Zetaproteobacteria bacterium]